MPWYFPWSDSIKKRACRYLLEHYLGQFLQEKLTLDQLTVDLFNGKGIVKRVPLDVLALNELLEGANVPLEILDGFIGTIAISVPWSSLMQDNCELEVKGVEITVGVKHDVDYAGSVVSESLAFSSMTSSFEIAQECLKGVESQDNEHTTTQQTFEGLESFAQTIESVLSRIKVSFQDVMIRFEHLFLNKKSGIALELHLQRIDYTDLSSDVSEGADQPSHDVFEPPSLAQKHLRIFGLKLSLDEFRESSRTLLRNNLCNDQSSPSPENLTPSPPLSPYHSALFTQSLTTNLNELNLLPAIVILSSAGEQEARVTWKLNPSCPGPKVDFEYFIGTLNIFISPKQLHLLLEMINDLNNLQNTALGSYIHSQGVVNKPMKAEDFHKIEKGLHEQMLNERKQEIPPGKIDLRDICFDNNHFHPLDSDKIIDEEEETFFSLTEEYPEVGHDATVKINGYPSSQGLVQKVSQAGIVPISDQDESKNVRRPSLPKFTGQNIGFAGISGLDDDTNNTTKGLFKLSGLSITLLLKDPVRGHSVLKSETSSHDHPLCKIADRFFDQISSTAFGSKDLDQIQEKYNNACVESHLRCFFATINISCELSNTSSCQRLTAETTVGLLKLVECLVKKTTDPPKHQLTELVNLSGRSEEYQLNSLGKFVSASPCLKAKYKSIQRSCSPASIQGRHNVVPKTEVDIQLGDTELELDITLQERLHDILYSSSGHEAQQQAPPPQYFASGTSRSHINQQALFSRTMTDGSSCDQKTHILLTCPNISASVRFPVPDLHRPDYRHIRSSIWKKSLRKEICLLHCTDVAFEATLQGDEHVASYEVRFKNLNGYVQFYNDNKQLVPFLRISQRLNENDSDSNGFDLPRIIFRVQPSISGPLLEEASSGNDSPDSLSDTCSILKTEPSPFSSKPVMHNEEELVVPGDASEMKVFQEKTSLSSKLHLELNFPEIEINLHDQSFFEMIYNRFGNDLLLWEPFDNSVVHQPQFDVTVNNMIGLDFAARMTQGRFPPDSFKMCHSAMNNDSYSSDEGDSDSFEQRKTLNTIQETPQSKIALTLNTSRARVVLFPHSKNNNEDGLGKIMLCFDNAQLFFVLDYKGKENLCYTSVQANYCSLHHGLMVDDMSSDMDTVFDSGHLYRTLYESEPGLKVTGSKCNVEECRPMFVVAVKSFLDTEKNAKEFVVAISLYGATLRHRVVHEGQMWLMQMVDFFCVTDEEIPGYVPPVVVTMLHVHFWNCAIHYRPLYIPYQLLITLEGFSVCSNIIADSKASILRFIIDNAVLLLSNNQGETMDLIKDYVSVGDVDLFEFSLHTVSDVEQTSPKLSLTLSNNIVHIRTCSDSLSALLDVMRYVASNGDFDATAVPACNSSSDDDKDEPFKDCPVEQRGPDAGNLDDLMSEAMVECNSGSNSNDKQCLDDEATKDSKPSTSPKLDVFDFPGDSSVMTSQHDECGGTTAVSADHCIEDEEDDDDLSDDEFCILDHPQKEQEVIYDEPKVKCSGDEIKIVPDHFSVPLGGVDQLKAPSNYPIPLYCYTVKEMSVIWQLYGGRDFDENKNDKKKKERRNDSLCSGVENGVMLSVEDEMDEDPVIIDSRANKKKKAAQPRVSWKTNAGVARDLNTLVEVQLTKIRFQYEEYPEETKQAWRQVLLIQDVEIRDRLSSSQINKLLYQYSTEARPKQTHANMVSIKILGLRPDVLLRSQEGCLRVSLKPLKLNIDQDTLQFFIKFFKDLSNTDEINNQDACFENPSSSKVSSRPGSPVTPSTAEQATTNTPPIFFRLFEFSPEVPIRLDYRGKHMDMGQRSVASLLFAFAQLNCSEIRLRRLCQRSGLLGFDRVISYALNEWANDIKKTQIPGILGGVGPTYSFVQLIQGVKDLFWLPIEQYRRDGRIIRGLQQGASSFTTSSAMAFLELTNKLVQVVHGAAEIAYDMVSPETSSRGQAVKRRVSHQPADFRQGVANAYNVVTEGFGQTACNIVQVAMEEHENKGLAGAVGGVLRHIPSVVVQPIILATEATSNVLGGVRNQILPDARREATEKWRQDVF